MPQAASACRSDLAMTDGVKAAVTKRDGPFGDYSQAPPAEQPRKRSEL